MPQKFYEGIQKGSYLGISNKGVHVGPKNKVFGWLQFQFG